MTNLVGLCSATPRTDPERENESMTAFRRQENPKMPTCRRILVPCEPWAFHGPLLKLRGAKADLGAIAEALLYYDEVFLLINRRVQFLGLLNWVNEVKEIESFTRLVSGGTVRFAFLDFESTAVYDPETGVYDVVNIEEENSGSRVPAFLRKVVYPEINDLIPKTRSRARFLNAMEGRIESYEADQYGSSIREAKADASTPRVVEATLQPVVELVWAQAFPHLPAPKVAAQVLKRADGGFSTTVNVNFKSLTAALGDEHFLHDGSVLIALVQSNRNLWAASRLNADLYLRPETGALVSTKLQGALQHNHRLNQVLNLLEFEAGFPDIENEVNYRALPFNCILELRERADRFRPWIHDVSESGRDALTAYYNEAIAFTGREIRLRKAVRALCGVGSGLVGATLASLDSPVGGVVGAAVGGLIGDLLFSEVVSKSPYLKELSESIDGGWHPVLFGNWASKQIDKK